MFENRVLSEVFWATRKEGRKDGRTEQETEPSCIMRRFMICDAYRILLGRVK